MKFKVSESDIDITEKRNLSGTGPACNRRVTSRSFVALWSEAATLSLITVEGPSSSKISGKGATIDDAIEELCAKTEKKLGCTIFLEDGSQKFLATTDW